MEKPLPGGKLTCSVVQNIYFRGSGTSLGKKNSVASNVHVKTGQRRVEGKQTNVWEGVSLVLEREEEPDVEI